MHETLGARLMRRSERSFHRWQADDRKHFGYTDGFGNPDFKGAQVRAGRASSRKAVGNLWRSEFLWDTRTRPVSFRCPIRTFWPAMGVHGYRQLPERRTFRATSTGGQYGSKEKLAGYPAGAWNTVNFLPTMGPRIVTIGSNTNFTYGGDLRGTRCPIGSPSPHQSTGRPGFNDQAH